MRKTFKVADLKKFINSRLLQSPDDQVEYRKGLIGALMKIFKDTDNHKGFIYLADLNSETPPEVYGLKRSKETLCKLHSDITRVEYL